MATAPPGHFEPLRHALNLRLMLITSRQRSLAFRKFRNIRSHEKMRVLPDTIGSGKHRVPFRAVPAHSRG